ncbi:hypothetical protein DD509_06745 [Dehalogenimonas alkenigignens]|nr:hypothetical protein DD509_06745 [Dehalogenimonas alkenigignens]
MSVAFAYLLMAKTNVYIDGFNFYYGALKHTPYKWIDLSRLCAHLFPADTIHRIRYFTARVKPTHNDPYAPIRQEIYLRALRTIPNLSIFLGRYVQHPGMAPQFPLVYINHPKRHSAVKSKLIEQPEYAYIADGSGSLDGCEPARTYVLDRQEKGSDVNLAAMLLSDCYEDDFEKAVVISNDSDLCMPIELSIKRCHKHVTVVNPHDKSYSSSHLKRIASDYVQTINRSVLISSQFPPTLRDTTGFFTKPAKW